MHVKQTKIHFIVDEMKQDWEHWALKFNFSLWKNTSKMYVLQVFVRFLYVQTKSKTVLL